MAATGGPALTTAVGVINRVHRDTANLRTFAQPALAAGFTQLGIGLIRIGHRTDGGHALGAHHANFTGGQA